MAKLSSLITGTARAFQVPESRVRTAAANLRKHGLIASGPRGPGAYEMTPLDATALILGIMYDGDLADSHVNVPRLWSAPLAHVRSVSGGEPRYDELPPNNFLKNENGEPAVFGMMLAAVIDWLVRYNSLWEVDEADNDIGPDNVRFTVSTPGHQGELSFTNLYEFWNLSYRWVSPEEQAYREKHKGDRFVTRWDALNGPYMSSSRSIDEYSLWRIADLLRGREYPDNTEEIEPPYLHRLGEQDENRFVVSVPQGPEAEAA